MKKKFGALLLALCMVLTILPAVSPVSVKAAASDSSIGVSYNTHVQRVGWQEYVQDGDTAGTEGRALRLEAIHINLNNSDYEGGIEYTTHVQKIGWQDWKSDGDLSGTEGQALRLEAIKIRLTGEISYYYDVYYRVHAQKFGWLDWTKNGLPSGTAGFGYRLEAIQIKLVAKDDTENAPSSTGYITDSFKKASSVSYATHVQSYGWQTAVSDGKMSGTSGQAKRLEAITIKLDNQEFDGSINYTTHVQSYGWQNWKSDGEMSGTSGQAKRLEGIRIWLSGDIAEYYTVTYRVHVQSIGWQDWKSSSEMAGTEGRGLRLEGIEIKLVPININDHWHTYTDWRESRDYDTSLRICTKCGAVQKKQHHYEVVGEGTDRQTEGWYLHRCTACGNEKWGGYSNPDDYAEMSYDTNYEYVILPEGTEYTEGITGYESRDKQATVKLGDTPVYELYLLLRNEDGTHTVVSPEQYTLDIEELHVNAMYEYRKLEDAASINGDSYQIVLKNIEEEGGYLIYLTALINDEFGERGMIIPENGHDSDRPIALYVEVEK